MTIDWSALRSLTAREIISALIRDDAETSLGIAWLRERIEAGLASGNAGPMTSEKLDRLIGEGIARVTR